MHPEVLVLKFLDAVDRDLASGGMRSLEAYLQLFPGHPGLVRSEYDRIAGADPVPEDLPSGSEIGGRYRVLESLGHGGFGEVYLAEDAKMARRVAVKVLSGLRAFSEEWRARLVREAEATSRFVDDGLCPVFDVGFQDGTPFLVMPWIPGRSLDRVLAASAARGEGPVQLGRKGGLLARRDEFLSLIERVARTLHAAHVAGIVHRDVKPANIMVRHDGRPVVIDFGLAWMQTDDESTSRSSGLGTPAYSAPEVLTEGRVPPTPSLDLWSLGVVLFEGLMLRRPFTARAGMSLERSILEEPTPRLFAALGRDLQAVVEKALARKAEHRYQSMAHFADDLGRARRGEPVVARAAGPMRRLHAWVRIRPRQFGFGVAALGLAFTSVTVGASWWVRNRERAVVVRAVDSLAASMDQLVRDTAKLERSGLAMQHRAIEAERLLTAVRELRAGIGASDDLDRALSGVLIAAGGLNLQLGDAARGAAEVAEAAALLTRLVAAEGATDDDRASLAHAIVLVGDGHAHQGDHAQALEKYSDAFAIDEALRQERPTDPTRVSNVAYGHLRIGYMQELLGHLEDGLRRGQEAVRHLRVALRLNPSNPARVSHIAEGLGVVAKLMQRLRRPQEETAACLDELLTMLQRQAEQFPLDSTVWQNLSGALGLAVDCSDDQEERLRLVAAQVAAAARVGQLEPNAPFKLAVVASAWRHQAEVHAAAGDLTKACDVANHAAKASREWLDHNPHEPTLLRVTAANLVGRIKTLLLADQELAAAAATQELMELVQSEWVHGTTPAAMAELGRILIDPGLGRFGEPQRLLLLLDAVRGEEGTLEPALRDLEREANKLLR
jgi:tetratricopeptide (TPR) repeat protein